MSAHFIADFLAQQLRKHSVFLLLSGGSAIKVYKQAFEKLSQSIADLNHPLTVSLFDERYVPKDSANSNETQLRKVGVIDLIEQLGGSWVSYLSDQNLNGQETAQETNRWFSEMLARKKTFLLILAGIGGDGHTAGILPTQDSATIEKVHHSDKLIEYYELPEDTDNPYRQRLTATPKLIEQADQVIVYAVGDDKKAALTDFKANQKPLNERPSLALHRSKSPVILLTDQKL
ncbi:MAG: hypothetical protein UY13_C0002G0096 [Candidatus Pacebacteria bacterium GW2011_GWB1_47_8]|nr:MAG: hypothetical protein UX28_C0001G0244 [Candidatus Pacebacteria bacterium GW2011_GWA1_46_10]KKU84184.1 MAG: hypothetical protein UY13_C0002G0096 [Candidatus Pacebacteria bacterium GW2011_GWB1_47_8]